VPSFRQSTASEPSSSSAPSAVAILWTVACRPSHAFGKLLKGEPVTLTRNGKIDRVEMQRSLVSEHDLEEDLHLDAKTEDISTIALARLERSGDISFIKKEQ